MKLVTGVCVVKACVVRFAYEEKTRLLAKVSETAFYCAAGRLFTKRIKLYLCSQKGVPAIANFIIALLHITCVMVEKLLSIYKKIIDLCFNSIFSDPSR